MNYLSPNDIRNLSASVAVEVHFSNYNRNINLIKEVRALTGCGLKEAVDIVRDRTMTLVVTGYQGVLNVLAMVNVLNMEYASPSSNSDFPNNAENSTLTVKFVLYNTKSVFRV